MRPSNAAPALLLFPLLCAAVLPPKAKAEKAAARVSIERDNVISLDGKRVFPIGFTEAPPPDGKTPGGGSAYAELKTLGTVLHRCGPKPGEWGAEAEVKLDHIFDRSAEEGIFTAPMFPGYQSLGPEDHEVEAELRRLVLKYRNHPALFCWKAEDEPEWGKVPVAKVQRFYDIVHELDPAHPVWLTQAPRGTIESLKAYNPAYDIGAIDIYPINYPPGGHSHLPNKNISVVGDYSAWMREITEERKPFWMVLQICWSGVWKPGKTLRFPTFPEERYMTYQAIINGARGLLYFGGNIEAGMNERDKALGWNWSFYYKVLEPVLRELAPEGPLYPALIAPESELALKMAGAADVEFCVREAGDFIFVLAAKREGDTVEVKFSGLPASIASGELLFEEPRKVQVAAGEFTDWFGPNEVHLYRFRK